MLNSKDSRFLPHSARRYSVTQTGDVFEGPNELKIDLIDDVPHVKLTWVDGFKDYPLGLLILICYKAFELEGHLWCRLEILYRDGNIRNNFPDNLFYRFKGGPLEIEGYPGFYYIPGALSYGISRSGDIVSIKSGKPLTWGKTKPCKKRNSQGGYSYCRITVGSCISKVLFRHRALCLTFKDYSEDVFEKVVNHIDGDPNNDSLENLEWCTYSENNKHAYAAGLRPNAAKAILMKDLSNGAVTQFVSIGAAARHLGWGRGDFIRHRIYNTPNKVYPDKLVFKLDDGSDWPNHDITKIIRSGQGQDFKARNVFTGDVIIFKGSLSGSKLIGVNEGTILKHAREKMNKPIDGYNIRYLDDPDPWPQHNWKHLEMYKKHPKRLGFGIDVLNLESGEETFYTSTAEVTEKLGVSKSSILTHARSGKICKEKYKFSIFNLD